MNSQGDAFLFPEGMTPSLLEIPASTFFLTISRFNVFAFPRVIPELGVSFIPRRKTADSTCTELTNRESLHRRKILIPVPLWICTLVACTERGLQNRRDIIAVPTWDRRRKLSNTDPGNPRLVAGVVIALASRFRLPDIRGNGVFGDCALRSKSSDVQLSR